ncbi:MAG TPA: hypothetical protein VMW38_17960 [Terriglobia bacterium]|nr:hypothetical protein [Terriglobia bacterium]
MRRAFPGWIILIAAIPAMVAPAQSQTVSLYRFAINQDSLKGAPDFSFLNHTLTAADRVFTKNGHFYTVGADLQANTNDDQRVRFFGISLTFGANFPDPDNGDAERIAKRLRRLGINLVRLHHMDSVQDPPDQLSNANGTLTTGPYPTFNDLSLRRLRSFLDALKNEGIYVDLNLHVGYLFRPTVDQVPSLPNGMPDQSKPLQIFYPRMVTLQQQYAQGLIERLQLKNDPVLAMVEISNESSVVSAWQWGQLDPVLVGDYRTALQNQWNAWLRAHYTSTNALAGAWGPSTPDGPNLLSGNWQVELHDSAWAILELITTDGLQTAHLSNVQGGGWLFLKQTGFTMTAGHRYAWTFQARAALAGAATANVPVSVMRDNSPWDGYQTSPYSITLTNQWQSFTILADAAFDILVNPPSQADGGRVMMDLESVNADVWVRGAKLVEAGEHGLLAGETIERGNVSLPGPADNPTAARLADYVRFLTSVDQNYDNTLRDAVRAGTDPLAPTTGTQIGYGGLSIFDSQDGLDYQDNHFYIDHPDFPGIAWDPWDWRIHNQAAVDDTWSGFLDMAWGREAGRPYTVSEYNQPWPNTHGAEIDPSLAVFASFQDWDAIMHFDYAGDRNWDGPIPNAFDANGDWTKFPVMGQSAWIFRTYAVRPSTARLSVPVSADQRLQATIHSESPMAWVTSRMLVPKEAALTREVELAKDSMNSLPNDATHAVNAPYVSDTAELTFNPTKKLLLVNAPMAAGVIGTIGAGNTQRSGPIDVELASTARGFASVLVTALDHKPIGHSGSLLVSVPGYSLRSLPAPGEQPPATGTAKPQNLVNYRGDPTWWTVDPANSDPSWGSWVRQVPPSGNMDSGYPPTYMERVECWVTLRTEATAITVTALDGAGSAMGTLPASEIQKADGGYRIHLQGNGQPLSPWYQLTASGVPLTPIEKVIDERQSRPNRNSNKTRSRN